MSSIKIALVGIGKIAIDQHLPALAHNADFELVALVSRSIAEQQEILERYPQARPFHDMDELLASGIAVDAVSLCVPPTVRYSLAVQALEAGLDVLLEKPPGRGVAEVESLRKIAEKQQRTLFASWHSRHAEQVENARAWLADKTPRAMTIEWREDVRFWHPEQEWVWEAGGMGVFDPAINAFSIATLLLPEGFYFTEAQLDIPGNRQQPIAATLKGALSGIHGGSVEVTLDWQKTGDPLWQIDITTDQGVMTLEEGGAHLVIDGKRADGSASPGEYPGLYQHFAELVKRNVLDVDARPLTLVADALMMGNRREVAEFHW